MGSKIEWTDETWNPVTGCTKVSPGCDHCYAERITERFHGKGSFGNVVLHEDRLNLPQRWRKPRRVFVNSMSDLFHEAVPDEFLERVFDAMEQAPDHTFQVLTKRHARMRSFVRARQQRKEDYALAFETHRMPERRTCPAAIWARERADNPPANIWLGVSVENQKWADIRIPALLGTPAAVRFLSCEPLLGPVDVGLVEEHDSCTCGTGPGGYYGTHERGCGTSPGPSWGRLHWVIIGGESGGKRREMDLWWAAAIAFQCRSAGVPVWVKQDSGPRSGMQGRISDDLWSLKQFPREPAAVTR